MNKYQNPRARASFLVQKWESKQLPLNLMLNEDLQQNPIVKHVDQQLYRAIVFGVVRWKGYIDQVLKKFSKHPLEKMDSEAKQVLRIALFQMLFMDRIPVSAAINESVNILKNQGRPRWLTGFVNGMLRNIDRGKEKLPIPGGNNGFPQHALHSYPKWMYDRWENRYGRNLAASICAAGNNPAPICLRAGNRDSLIEILSKSGINSLKGQFSPQAVILDKYRGDVENLPGYKEGLFQVQDEAAQLVSYMLALNKPVRCLDACAGLGGKTTHLAEILPEGSTIVAIEPDQRRRELLGQNLTRLNVLDKVEIVSGKLHDMSIENQPSFDAILIDAPCSGTGVIRQHPDIRWNRKLNDLERYQKLQLELLDSAVPLLNPGGIVVYATCSIEPEENVEVIDAFLGAHSKFSIDDCQGPLPDQARKLVSERGFFHPLPDLGLDGFFAARLIKKDT